MSASAIADGQGVQRARLSAELVGETLCMLERSVGDVGDDGAPGTEVASRELAHPSGADEHDAAIVEVLEDLLGERGRRRRDRRRALPDRCLDAGSPSCVERHSEHPVEERPRRAGLERVTHLAEDLALARNHRVEARRDAEKVQRGRLVRQPVRNGSKGLRGGPGEREQRAVGAIRKPGVLLGSDVELGAVARREDDGLEGLSRRELSRESRCSPEIDRDALAELERGAVVRDACERESHVAKWVSGSTMAMSAAPATSSHASRLPCRPASWRRISASA